MRLENNGLCFNTLCRKLQGIMLLLQNLPTHSWGDQQICELTADAFSLMALFDGAKNHLAHDVNI